MATTPMMENKNRIQIFDIAKGISIILMTISRYSFTEIYPTLLSFQNIVIRCTHFSDRNLNDLR